MANEHAGDPGAPMQVGGQAVIEGVMMRAPGKVATAVRTSDGSVVVRENAFRSLTEKGRLFKLPVVRGAIGLVEMLAIGVSTLNFSAEVALRDLPGGGGDNGKDGEKRPAAAPTEPNKLRIGLTVAVALLAGLAIFFVTPLFVTSLLFNVNQEPLAFNLIAGSIRIALFLAYLAAIAMMKDVQRLFAYHGAEHKAVFTFEKGEELTVEHAARQSRFHPRCGTSFLLIVLLAAILSFALLDALLIRQLGTITILTRLLTHLPLIPVVGGISYEFIRVSARKSGTPVGKMIVAPGLWLQRITTREPDDSQLEIALIALRAALGKEHASCSTPILPAPDLISVS